MKKLTKKHSSNTFKSNQSHDSAYRPEKSTVNLSPTKDRLNSQREGEKILHFSDYLSKEIKDVVDFKRFLGQLREAL
jgi:hypothetical protein